MHIVGITGRRGHGKNTASEALERAGYKHLSFADPVREIVNLVYGVPFEVMADTALKEAVLDRWPFKTPRELMQKVGTEMFRETKFNDDLPLDDTWIEVFKRRAAGFSHVVCSDVRFPNEATMIRALGGKIIKIENPRLPRVSAVDMHPSETGVDLITPDWTIQNERGIADLQTAIEMLVLDDVAKSGARPPISPVGG